MPQPPTLLAEAQARAEADHRRRLAELKELAPLLAQGQVLVRQGRRGRDAGGLTVNQKATPNTAKGEIPPSAIATDVGTFIGELEAGLFESQLSVALSETAAAVVDHESKKGAKVTITLDFEHIAGTSQVRIGHAVKFERPTRFGKRAESCKGASVMHVGKRGRLSVTQPEIDGMQGRQATLDP